MLEQTSTVTESVSAGSVTIAIEKYQELVKAAATKAPVIQTMKSTAQVAEDNITIGTALTLMGIGSIFIGTYLRRTGERQMKRAKKAKA